jgi:hypothetical protein
MAETNQVFHERAVNAFAAGIVDQDGAADGHGFGILIQRDVALRHIGQHFQVDRHFGSAAA